MGQISARWYFALQRKAHFCLHLHTVYTILTQYCPSPTATTQPVPTITHISLHSPTQGPSMGQISAKWYFPFQKKSPFCFAPPYCLHNIDAILSITYSHNAAG